VFVVLPYFIERHAAQELGFGAFGDDAGLELEEEFSDSGSSGFEMRVTQWKARHDIRVSDWYAEGSVDGCELFVQLDGVECWLRVETARFVGRGPAYY
jgi:hypothetical protein